MLKISKNTATRQLIILRLEGRIIGPWVDELRLICESLVNQSQPLALDLTEVSFADEGGVALLISLRERGAMLRQPPPLLEEQLKIAQGSSSVWTRPEGR